MVTILVLGHGKVLVFNALFIFTCSVLAAFCIVFIVSLILPKLKVLMYGGTGIYSTHLRKIYAKHKVSSGGKWPAIKVKAYINLAIVSYAPRDLDEIRQHVLHGNIEKLLEGKESIEVKDIFQPKENMSLLLVEGAPGIGKSTLAWELCRRWLKDAPYMKHFRLVVLHRLRDDDTQQIGEVHELFPHENKKIQQLVADEVTATEGRGILFILDGFDEYPQKYIYNNFLIKLITGRVLPESTVLVTTRPSATATLFLHEPHVDRRIEILGFTQGQVKKFASDAFSDYKEDVLENFLKYIEASKNPAINSLMYIPLNAAIIAEIYKSNHKIGLPIPRTLTQLYTELCLTMLRRFLIADDPHQIYILDKIKDLYDYGDYYSHFQNLSRLAFEEFNNDKAIFYTLPKNLTHFGLLDSVQSLHGGGSVSYNFLHLTIQEFLTAYYISFHSEKQDFREYGHNKRWNLIWRFVAGFTKFDYFVNHTHSKMFVDIEKNRVQVQMFLLLCLFEAGNFNFAHIYEEQSVFKLDLRVGLSRTFHTMTNPYYTTTSGELSPMDKYVLGYCLVNSAPTVSWEISIEAKSLETFMWGLKSVKYFKRSIIHVLQLYDASETYLEDYPTEILQDLSSLELINCEVKGLGLALSVMKHLKSLTVSPKSTCVQSNLAEDMNFHVEHSLQQFLDKNIAVNSRFHELSVYLRELIHPQIGTLKCLCWLDCPDVCDTKFLTDSLFKPTSLEVLAISICNDEASFDLLKTNSHLKNLTIKMALLSPPFDSLKGVLEHNTALQYLTLLIHEEVLTENYNKLKLIADAVVLNKHLKELAIKIYHSPDSYTISLSRMEQDYLDLKIDSRIIITDFDENSLPNYIFCPIR